MDKLLYISTGIPDEEVNKLREKQFDFSTNAMYPISVFHGNILSGLREVYDDICALSGIPISRKHFDIIHYSSKRIEKGNLVYIIPGFVNIRLIKQLTVIAKIWWHIICWYKQNKNHNCHIVIDGTFYSGLIALALASGYVKAPKAAILVDYYSFMDPAREKLSQKLFYKLLKCIDSFIFVTDYLERTVNLDKKRYMIMEGLVSVQHTEPSTAYVGNYCMYAGGLNTIYGVNNLVDAFLETDLPYSLHLYGNGDLVEYIKQVGEQDDRIVYKGTLPHEQLLEVERSAKLLINPRPVRGKLDTRFNFPSKLMEYMQSGRPVITTKLLGIPKEYDNYMFYFEGDSKDSIKEGLEKILGISEDELACAGMRARNYVNENKNNIAVGSKLFDMMNQKGRVDNE